ncbi:hypothetical protein [Alteromonas oceanisediminis]|uniref:hypothetical protein n=1 Tax=Alteromonas oceanisediminis TaxID=2836180 RepID=UPI001BD926B1|nr:hypothetical protein [Alteromonas oceanisediminis]MBT0585574.1 hypothetical protein [Alteromonas oceanisediminis]
MKIRLPIKRSVLILAPLTAMFSATLQAHDHDKDNDVYSTEAYCLLQKENVDHRYLEAYAKKLGMVPSRKTCRSFLEFAESVTPKEWDYPQGKPYPGSVIRLTPAQIEKIKGAKNQND